jgi:nitroimidazol reductase NimA-like FMN-containing flavoprotein (pyridoxamine 5'-phosphate oxidase superfamily)
MIDKLKQETAEFLQQHQTGHLALTGLEGPWAAVVRFISAGLTLYLLEPSASDLVFFIENDSHLVLTVDEPEAIPTGGHRRSVQLFGTARILAPPELNREPAEIQTAYASKNRQAPGVYVVIKIDPKRIYRIIHDNGATHRDTIDVDATYGCH